MISHHAFTQDAKFKPLSPSKKMYLHRNLYVWFGRSESFFFINSRNKNMQGLPTLCYTIFNKVAFFFLSLFSSFNSFHTFPPFSGMLFVCRPFLRAGSFCNCHTLLPFLNDFFFICG